jgi:hypothetical protein
MWPTTHADYDCAAAVAVPAERARKLDEMLSAAASRAATPAFVHELMSIGPAHYLDDKPDFSELLAAHIDTDIQWPHINVRFMDLFVTLPGLHHPMLCPSDCRY